MTKENENKMLELAFKAGKQVGEEMVKLDIDPDFGYSVINFFKHALFIPYQIREMDKFRVKTEHAGEVEEME